jgi:hypothetical protein
MQCGNLTEVKSNDRKGDCHGEQTWTIEQCPEKEPPILDALGSYDSEVINRSPQCKEILGIGNYSDPQRFVFLQKCFYALVIMLGSINLM